MDELKTGARNNTQDRERIRKIREMARQIHDTTMEMEPADTDPEVEMPKDTEILMKGNALKAIQKTDDELRVENYMILFGGRDLTGVVYTRNDDGSMGEYFSERTEFDSDYTKTGMLYVDWEHGYDPDRLGISDEDILGYVDWKTAKKDKRGVFVQRVLNRRKDYVKWLEELIDAGLVGNSSAAIPGQIAKAADGEILLWPLKRDSLTVNPMEPRMLTENQINAIKGLSDKIPSLKSLIPEPEAGNGPAAAVDEPELSVPNHEVKTMELTEEKLNELLEQAAVKAVEKAQPATVKAGAVTVTKDEADQPFETAGKFFQAVKTAALYPQAEDVRLRSLKAPLGANETNPAEGGYLIPPQVASGILERVYNDSPLLSRVSIDPVQGNSMTYNKVDETSRADGSRWGGIQAYWGAEAASITTSKPKFSQMELKLKKVFALCYATDELLDDAGALQSWMTRTVPQELRFKVEAAVFSGNGVGKPLGFMNAPCLNTVARDTGSRILLADVLGMYAVRYAPLRDYVWLIGQDSFTQLPQITLGSYQGVFMPAGGISGAPYSTLFGFPVIETEYNPALNTTGDIVLASLSQYQMISKGGVQAASSIHVAFTTGEQAFRFTYRIDGQPIWDSALTPYNGSAAVSPFVCLKSAT